MKVGTTTLVTHTYGANNGNLLSSAYGNGFTVEYVYDSLNRVTKAKYNGTIQYEYVYNAMGQLAEYTDHRSEVSYTYYYDLIGRLLRTEGSDGTRYETSYDNVDKVTEVSYTYEGERREMTYSYSDRDNLPETTGWGSNRSKTQSYDALGRLNQSSIATGSSTITSTYGYLDKDTTNTTAIVNETEVLMFDGKTTIMWKEIALFFLCLYLIRFALDLYMIKRFQKIAAAFKNPTAELSSVKDKALRHRKLCDWFSSGPWNKGICSIYNGLCCIAASIELLEGNETAFLLHMNETKRDQLYSPKFFMLAIYHRTKGNHTLAMQYRQAYAKATPENKQYETILSYLFEGIGDISLVRQAAQGVINNPAIIKLLEENGLR